MQVLAGKAIIPGIEKPTDHPVLFKPMPEVFVDLGKKMEDYDVVCFADGSGSTWSRAGGFAFVLVELKENNRKSIMSGYTNATSQSMEIIPFCYGIDWYCKAILKKREGFISLKKVLCLSDNKNVVDQGNQRVLNKNNREYFGYPNLIENARNYSLLLEYAWIPRNTIGLNRLCDFFSKRAREAMQPDGPKKLFRNMPLSLLFSQMAHRVNPLKQKSNN